MEEQKEDSKPNKIDELIQKKLPVKNNYLSNTEHLESSDIQRMIERDFEKTVPHNIKIREKILNDSNIGRNANLQDLKQFESFKNQNNDMIIAEQDNIEKEEKPNQKQDESILNVFKNDIDYIRPRLTLIKKKLKKKKDLNITRLTQQFSTIEHSINVTRLEKSVELKRSFNKPTKSKSRKKPKLKKSFIKAQKNDSVKNKSIIEAETGQNDEQEEGTKVEKKPYLKRKTKRVEFKKVNWKNVKSKVGCWVDNENNEMKLKQKKEKEKEMKRQREIAHKKKMAAIKKKKSKVQSIRHHRESEDEEDEIDFETIKDTYFNHYLDKFGSITQLEPYESEEGYVLANLDFDSYLFDGYSFPVIVSDANAYEAYLDKVNENYEMIMNN